MNEVLVLSQLVLVSKNLTNGERDLKMTNGLRDLKMEIKILEWVACTMIYLGIIKGLLQLVLKIIVQ